MSVVIPAYNCASFLAATLESVFAQTLPALEVIVVDDGSTDETDQVVKPYLDRVVYLKQKNKGLPGARNTGITASRGAFIALLDADDSWIRSKLASQMPQFADPEIGIVYSDFSVRYADGRFQDSYLVNRPLAAQGSILDNYIQSRFLFPSTMIFRRMCFEQIGMFDEEMLACEDIELFSRMCAHWKVALVNEPLMVRYEGSHNITAKSGVMSEYTILAFEKLLSKERELSRTTKGIVRQELSRQHSWAGYEAFHRGERAKARDHLWKAVRLDPWHTRSSFALLAGSFLPRWLLGRLRRNGGAKRRD